MAAPLSSPAATQTVVDGHVIAFRTTTPAGSVSRTQVLPLPTATPPISPTVLPTATQCDVVGHETPLIDVKEGW